DDVARVFRGLGQRAAAVQGVGEDGGRPDVEAGDHRLLDLLRQLEPYLRHTLANLCRSVLEIDAELEDDHRRGNTFTRRRSHAIDSVHRNDRVFDGLRDQLLDFARRGARVGNVDDDDGKGDVRKEIRSE